MSANQQNVVNHSNFNLHSVRLPDDFILHVGSLTTTATLHQILAILAANQDIQNKIHEDIQANIGARSAPIHYYDQ